MQRGPIGIRIYGYGSYSHLATGADDSYRNFSTIGDQNLVEHLL
jgi:hypothetical protein